MSKPFIHVLRRDSKNTFQKVVFLTVYQFPLQELDTFGGFSGHFLQGSQHLCLAVCSPAPEPPSEKGSTLNG